jgi:hypothetical protein
MSKGRPKLSKHNKTPQPHRQPQIRIMDPGKTPLGPPRIVGEGTYARQVVETRQQRRARERRGE